MSPLRLSTLALFGLALFSDMALAIEMRFYTYNGFDETVAAFTRMGLIFSDDSFNMFFWIFVLSGVVFAGLKFALMGGILGMNGGGTKNPLELFFPILIGLILVKGMVLNTGSVWVWDPVRNANHKVPGIPNLIVLIAGTMNIVERGLVEIIDTASAHPYADTAGTISYALIHAANRSDLNDYYLEQSLVNYYLDCGVPALGQGSGGGRQRLLHSTSNMMTEFARWQNAALFTTYYADNSDAGEVRSCKEAWSGKSTSPPGTPGNQQTNTDSLQARLAAASNFSDYKESVCRQAGFDPSSAPQLQKCSTALGDAAQLFGQASSNDVSLLRAMVMARAISNALDSSDFSQTQRTLVDRQVVAEGFGTAEAMDQWIPKVRAFLTAVILGCVPVLVLFMVTPAFKNAITLLLGLFGWLMMWGVCDIIAVQMAEDAAADAFDQIRRQNFSLEAILHSPEAAVQALGVFGKSRMVAIGLATVLSSSLFKFGGYAFARMGEQWQDHLGQAGEKAGRQTMLPEEHAQMQRSLVSAVAFQGAQGQIGFDHMAGGQAIGDMQSGHLSSYISNDLSMNAGSYGHMHARSAAVSTVGTDQGYEAAAAHTGQSYSESAIGAISQSAGESHVGATARREFGREVYGDALDPAARDAKFGIARTAATDDAVTAFKKGGQLDDSTAVRGAFRVLGAGDIARTGEFSSGEAIAAERFRAQSDNSFTQAMAGRGVGGDDAGRARAFFESGQTKATLRAGADAIEASEQLSRGEMAGRAAVASELSGGDPFSFGQASGIRQGTVGAAELWRDQTVAQTLGLDSEDIRDNVQYQRMSNSQVQLAPTSDQIKRIADNPNVDLSPEQRSFMRENPDAGYVQNFNLNSDGQWVAGSIKSGIDLSSGNFSQFRDGTSHEVRDDVIYSNRMDYDVSEDTRGGNRLLEGGHAEVLMSRAFSLDGSVDQSSLAAFGKSYGEALSDRGFTLSSQKADEYSSRFGISGFAEVSGEKRFGLSFFGNGASARIQAGARTSKDISNGWSDTESVHTNKNLLLMQSLGAGAVEQAKTEYIDRHGALPEAGSNFSAERANAYTQIYARAGELFRGDFEDLVKTTQATHADDIKSIDGKPNNDTDQRDPNSPDSRRSFRGFKAL